MSSLVLLLRKDRRLFPRPLPFRLQNRRSRRVGLCENRLHAFLNLVYCRKTCSPKAGLDSAFSIVGVTMLPCSSAIGSKSGP